MNRRQFLYSGTALTAMSTGSMSARSYASILGANDRVGLGIVGLGRRATVVTRGFVQDPRANIIALCDIYDKQVADYSNRFKAHLSQPAVFVEYQKLLAHKDVDAVYLATPDHLHVQIAKDTITAGKHLYMEKPTLHRWSERAVLVQANANNKHVLQCGMQQRSGAHYIKAKKEIFGPKLLGDMVFVRAVWSDFSWQNRKIAEEPKPAGLNWELFLGPAPHVPYKTSRYSSWRWYHDYGNGLLADIMTHWADVAQWMLDDAHPVNASALGGKYHSHSDDRDNPDTVSAIVQYKDWNLNFESSVLPIKGGPASVYFEGTKGTLNITRGGYTFTPNGGEPVKVENKVELEVPHTKNFLDAILLGSKVNAPLSAGLDASLPVEMALQSYWSHKMSTSAGLV